MGQLLKYLINEGHISASADRQADRCTALLCIMNQLRLCLGQILLSNCTSKNLHWVSGRISLLVWPLAKRSLCSWNLCLFLCSWNPPFLLPFPIHSGPVSEDFQQFVAHKVWPITYTKIFRTKGELFFLSVLLFGKCSQCKIRCKQELGN